MARALSQATCRPTCSVGLPKGESVKHDGGLCSERRIHTVETFGNKNVNFVCMMSL